MRIFKNLLIFLFGILLFLSLGETTYAIRYDLIAPSGQLQRGQQVQFTINIDTQGASITSADIGMTYDTQYLQYVGIVTGDAMSTVTANELGDGKILFSGTNNSGFKGTGTFVQVNFTLIAQAAGSTELCVLWAPSPTAQPTTSPNQPTTPPAQPTTPLPTRLPTSGAEFRNNLSIYAGFIFLIIATGFYFLYKK